MLERQDTKRLRMGFADYLPWVGWVDGGLVSKLN
jgi:hypothetical protein